MPLLSTFGGSSVKGFGAGLSSRLVGIISDAASGSSLNSPLAGDIVVSVTGNLTTPRTIPTGYSQILGLTSSSVWGSQPNYKVSGTLSYRILDGTESTGPGSFVHVRYSKPATSISVIQSSIRTGGFTASFSAQSGLYLGVILVTGRGAYNGGVGNFSGLPAGYESVEHSTSTSGAKFALSDSGGSSNVAAGGFVGAGIFAQFQVNG